MPKFDFTVTSPSRSDSSDAKQHHAEIVRDFVAGLDDFVDETEAQTALDRVLAARMEDPGTHGAVKRTDQGRSASINTSDLKYGPVGASRAFRLRVDAPTVVKDRSVSSTTTTHGEKSIVGETNFGGQTETESTNVSAVESQRLSQIESSLRRGVKGVFENFYQHDQSSESVTFKDASKRGSLPHAMASASIVTTSRCCRCTAPACHIQNLDLSLRRPGGGPS